jgi:hypothetical protein
VAEDYRVLVAVISKILVAFYHKKERGGNELGKYLTTLEERRRVVLIAG